MTRDDLAPIGQDDPGFPCPCCGGSGIQRCTTAMADTITFTCTVCNGSGYGPPPPALDRLRAHCLERLARWASRNMPPPEEMED